MAKGLLGEVASDVEFRVSAKISGEVPVQYSSPITLKITPYTVVIVYPQLQVPGAYQGWDPGNNNTVIFSVRSDGKYEGYLYFPDPNTEFKYTDGPSWDTNWGDSGADGTLEPGGDNLKAVDAGVYKLNVDLNSLTHSFLKTDWGLIGSATPNGWDSDQPMTYDAANNKWTITLDLVAGEIKFRANAGWDINLGDDNADKKMEYGGANIAVVEDGNYTVDLNLNAAVYTYVVTKN
ncbi:MAG: SusF/SusE family outer membrane protein [Lewinellaceae bacterium]|nr:SusF/SusE family outer membrane protein [Lewinellaceae bacterium]